jgi:hypothetical protein
LSLTQRKEGIVRKEGRRQLKEEKWNLEDERWNRNRLKKKLQMEERVTSSSIPSPHRFLAFCFLLLASADSLSLSVCFS